MKPCPKTTEELAALPLHESISYILETDPVTGHTIRIPVYPEVHCHGTHRDDVLFFRDGDGELMSPVYNPTKDRWEKRKILL